MSLCVFLQLTYILYVFNPVLNHQSGFPVLTAENEQRNVDMPEHHCCDQCGQSFSKLYRLRRHQRNHIGGRPYQSGKDVPNMLGLTRRQRMHNRETSDNSSIKHQGDDAIDRVLDRKGHPLLSLCVSGQMVTFLVDTGSTVSFLRQQDLSCYCCEETAASCEMEIDLDGRTYYHSFAVQPNLPVAILGRDLLSKITTL